jgi:hypothetical protein
VPPFLIQVLDRGDWPDSRASRFTPRDSSHQVPIQYETGWAPEPVLTLCRTEKSFASAGKQTPIPRTFSPSSQLYRLNYCGSSKAHTRKYCTVLAVLVRFTDYTTQLFTILYCRLHYRYYNQYITLGSDPLLSCVRAVFSRPHFSKARS